MSISTHTAFRVYADDVAIGWAPGTTHPDYPHEGYFPNSLNITVSGAIRLGHSVRVIQEYEYVPVAAFEAWIDSEGYVVLTKEGDA